MTTNLFVITNVKQSNLGSFRILLPFFRTSWCVGVLNSAVFNSFHNRVQFGTILEGLRNWGGGVWTPQPPHRYATACDRNWTAYSSAAHRVDWGGLSRPSCGDEFAWTSYSSELRHSNHDVPSGKYKDRVLKLTTAPPASPVQLVQLFAM